jgi:hypothetical protein
MAKRWVLGTLLALAGGLNAGDLIDWNSVELGKGAGSYADEEGGKVGLKLVEGPSKGQKALQVTADFKHWGGAWAYAGDTDLSKASGLRFKAKAAQGAHLLVSLTDHKKVQVEATVRVQAGDWQDFALPMALFKKSAWQQPEAPKDGAFDPSKVTTLNLSPRGAGKSGFSVGPLSIATGPLEAATGMMDGFGKDGALLVQDFEGLGTGAYGTFVDEAGSKLGLALKAGERGQGLAFSSQQAEGGWSGAWMRAGDAWGGQDWRGAKRITLRVKSGKPVALQLAFNDAKQNAYISSDVTAEGGKGWQTLELPFSSFTLNPYYQPPQAQKGAALDLSHIETFNISVRTPGKAEFVVDEVVLFKK